MRGGFVGVDVFFVISGFLISSIIFSQLEKDTFSFWNFYSRRIRRIYPTLITVLAFCLLAGFFFLLSGARVSDYFLLSPEYAQLGKHVAGGAGFISNFLLWFESGYFDNAANAKPLLHLWSLGIEEQFYIVWPLFLWLAWKKRFNLFAVSAIIAAVSFGVNWYVWKTDPVADFFSPQTRFWELLCGAMLAWITLHPDSPLSRKTGLSSFPAEKDEEKQRKLQHVLSIAGAVLLAASVFLIRNNSTRSYPGAWALFPVLATVLLIAAGKEGWFNKRILSNRTLVWFGLISYPLYLWHWPLLSLARVVLREEPSGWIRAAAFPVCILLAWLTTKFIENPLRFGIHGTLKTVALFMVMLCLGLAGFVIYKKEGFSSEWPMPEPALILNDILMKDHKTNPAFWNGCSQNTFDQYKACPHLASHPSKPTMVIWGDSHATHLVPGFEKNDGDRFNILQRTGASCPAVLAGLKRKSKDSCLRKNSLILKELVRIQPDYIVLAGFWHEYPGIYEHLGHTITGLREHGLHNIVIIGPVPVWKNKLPIELRRAYSKEGALPDRIRADEKKFLPADRVLSELAVKWQVRYVSPARLLCNETGCLARADDAVGSVLSFDGSHLTEAGSDYLVSLFRKDPVFREK